MCGEANFIDILVARRTQSGIFRFMTRDWYPKKTQELEKNFTPQNLKDIASRSLYLEAVIEAESLNTGVSKEELKKEVLKYIEEIGMDKKLHVIRWLGIFCIKLAFNMNIGIFVNETAILKVKSTMGKNPLLFLPTHRSYADFCILTYLCYHYDIEFPAVASGMDFYSMAVMGQVMRETCAFYIRRTLVGAPLYAATLKQYVRTLVAKYSAPIEFFLEGTRSRSNKSMPPKYGMLSMALTPLFAREVPDITIVPVNISYDRLMEQCTFAYELLGVPKPKESTRGLLKWLTSLNDQFGNMYINFGEPISVRDYLKKIPHSDESLKPLDLQNLSPEQFRQVQEVAEYTVTQQQANTVATISNLLAIVLMQSVVNQKCLTYEQVLDEVDWLKKVLRDLGGTVFEDDVTRNVDRILSIHAKSWALDKDRQLRLVSSDVIVVTDDLKRKMKGHILNAETMMNAIPVIQLQIYVNPILHYLVPSALICLLVQRGSLTMDELRQRYRCLRKLLRHEFFHIEQNEEKTFKQAFDYCVRNGVATVVGARVEAGAGAAGGVGQTGARAAGGAGRAGAAGEGGMAGGAGQTGAGVAGGAGGGTLRRLLRGVAWPALTTLKICADVITEQGSCTHSDVVKLVQSRAERTRRHPYCLSLDAAAHAVLGLTAAGALVKDKREDITEYHLVPDVMAKCRELVDSVLPDIEADFSSRNPVILDRRAKSRL